MNPSSGASASLDAFDTLDVEIVKVRDPQETLILLQRAAKITERLMEKHVHGSSQVVKPRKKDTRATVATGDDRQSCAGAYWRGNVTENDPTRDRMGRTRKKHRKTFFDNAECKNDADPTLRGPPSDAYPKGRPICATCRKKYYNDKSRDIIS